MKKTVFNIPKMDCASEENLIRLALDDVPSVKNMTFDLATRQITVQHAGSSDEILAKLEPLKLNASLINSKEVTEVDELFLEKFADIIHTKQRTVLRWVFVINGVMFLAEFIAGWVAQSAGLLADSLDMFADATVFALSLYAVGRSIHLKKRAAGISAYFQMILAMGAFIEVVRHFIYGSEPQAPIMMMVASIALVANVICMWILSQHRKGEVHMQASWIFLSNDVIANALVILAGFLVKMTHSQIPDLVAGTIIGTVVFMGSLKILKVART